VLQYSIATTNKTNARFINILPEIHVPYIYNDT
jgi:hypothetical protein